MRVTVLLGLAVAAALVAAGAVPGMAQTPERISVTTYYPSPYGVYKTLRLQPDNDFSINSAAGCSAATKGSVHFNDSWNVLMVCNGSTWSPMQPPGTLCGYRDSSGAGSLIQCMGSDPSSGSCPSGYSSRTFSTGGATPVTWSTCIKT